LLTSEQQTTALHVDSVVVPKPAPRRVERVRLDGKYFSQSGRRFHINGVTYGPFQSTEAGQPFPDREQVVQDFSAMREAGINAVRTYHFPPAWLFELADSHAVQLFVDIPWRKHLCFLDSRTARVEAREAVRAAAERGRRYRSLLAYSVGNEIPPDIIRWHG